MNYWIVWWYRFWQSVFTPLAANDPFYNEQIERGDVPIEPHVSSGHVRSNSNVVPFSSSSITRR